MQRNHWRENNPDHCLQMISLQQSLQCDLIPGETMLYCDHINLCDIYPPGAALSKSIQPSESLQASCGILLQSFVSRFGKTAAKSDPALPPSPGTPLTPAMENLKNKSLCLEIFGCCKRTSAQWFCNICRVWIRIQLHICIGLSIGFFQWIIRLPLSVCQFLSWTLVGRQERGVEASSRDGNWNPEKSASQLEGAAAGGREAGGGLQLSANVQCKPCKCYPPSSAW